MRREIYKLTKLKDLTGLKFGKLTAVKIDRDKKKRVYWICKCECGKNKSVASCHLTMGRITHCGCIKRVAHNFVNLEGKTFGNLKVLKISKDNQKIVRIIPLGTCVNASVETSVWFGDLI